MKHDYFIIIIIIDILSKFQDKKDGFSLECKGSSPFCQEKLMMVMMIAHAPLFIPLLLFFCELRTYIACNKTILL
jgi:hypothetical protein